MSVIEKLKIWGIKGAFDFLVARFAVWRMAKMFRDNARKYPCPCPQMGITIVGTLSDRGSLSKVMRDFCFSLKDAGIPFQTYDLGRGMVFDEDISAILTPKDEFRISKYTHLVEMIHSPVPDGIVHNRGRVVFWEFEGGLEQGYPVLFDRMGDVIGMSDFNFNYYKRVFTDIRKVRRILYPLRVFNGNVLSMLEARKKFRIPKCDFVVFYNFSYKSGIDRKNPEGAMKAFAMALGDVSTAKIVFKTASAAEFPESVERLKKLAAELNILDKVVFIDDYLSQNDVMNLTNAADVYLSLHRAEGFGLGIAEAMSLGKPVVITDYSSTTEFCNQANSMPIGYEMVPIKDCANKLYSAADVWAEPNVDDAAKALLMLYNDVGLRKRLGAVAKDSILQQYSIRNFKKSVMEYISEPEERT